MSVFCNTTTTMVNDVECVQCVHCNMFGHLVGDCAMLTGEYDEGKFSNSDGFASGVSSYSEERSSKEYFTDEEYVDYYAEYDKYLRVCGDEHVSSLCDPMEQEGEEWGQEDDEWGQEDGGEGNTLTEEEYAQWMREAEEEDEYADYADNHSPEADVRWVKQSSMAAFDHFQKTGAQLRNSEFVGKKAGAYLKSEIRAMDE